MPARADIYNGLEKLLLASGMRTVWRGPFFPDEQTLPGESYPVAGYVDQGSVIYDNHNYGFSIKGQIDVVLWVQTGEISGPLGGQAGWDQLDALHDAIMYEFLRSYQTYFSQTTVVVPERFTPIYGYRGAEGATVSASPAVLQVHYELNFA